MKKTHRSPLEPQDDPIRPPSLSSLSSPCWSWTTRTALTIKWSFKSYYGKQQQQEQQQQQKKKGCESNLIMGSQSRSCFSGATSFWNWSSRMLLNWSLRKLSFTFYFFKSFTQSEIWPAVFPLKVHPHHHSQLHVRHHHVLKTVLKCILYFLCSPCSPVYIQVEGYHQWQGGVVRVNRWHVHFIGILENSCFSTFCEYL